MSKFHNIKARSAYTFRNKEKDPIWILKTFRRHTDNELYVSIYFPKTGYKTVAPYNQVRTGEVKDRRKPTVLGLGYLGDKYEELKRDDPILCKALYDRWKFMIYRCYNENHKSHKSYFDKDVRVCERWHSFSSFFYDAQELVGWDRQLLLENKISLDKDARQFNEDTNKVYSPSTCIWLSAKEQQKYVDHYTPQKKVTLKVIHPDGRITIEEGLSRIAKKYNVDMKCINRVLKGQQPNTKGYRFERCNNEESDYR